MKVYRVEFLLHATVFIRALDKDEAASKATDLHNAAIDLPESDLAVAEGLYLSGLPFGDPELPDQALSPVITIGAPDLAHIEEAE